MGVVIVIHSGLILSSIHSGDEFSLIPMNIHQKKQCMFPSLKNVVDNNLNSFKIQSNISHSEGWSVTSYLDNIIYD